MEPQSESNLPAPINAVAPDDTPAPVIDRDLPLLAYETSGRTPPMIARPPHERAWMDQTKNQFAYRCLPLVIANQMGWEILNPHPIQAFWTGQPTTDSLVVQYLSVQQKVPWRLALSHFGYGVLTFSIPYLFRTPPDFNLWVKGPANRPKDGIVALEGMVETDWSVSTFTMNWKFTRPNHIVQFEAGEPIAQIVPYPRHLIERFDPSVRSIEEDAALAEQYRVWMQSRAGFNVALKKGELDAVKQKWQRDYFQGRLPSGDRFEPHQSKLHTAPFKREEDDKG